MAGPDERQVFAVNYFCLFIERSCLPSLFEQVMCTLVTIIAPRELAEHLRVVWCTMAILALWNDGMLVGMAEDALETCVLGGTSLKNSLDVIMACAAVAVGYFSAIGKRQGLMCLVTPDAVLEFLVFDMRLVAAQAVRPVTMFVVAEGAIYHCMGTWIGVNFRDNI